MLIKCSYARRTRRRATEDQENVIDGELEREIDWRVAATERSYLVNDGIQCKITHFDVQLDLSTEESAEEQV